MGQAICKRLRILKKTGDSRSLYAGAERISVFSLSKDKLLKHLAQERDGNNF